MTVDLTTFKSAWKPTEDPIISRYILRPDFQCYDGQEFVWRTYGRNWSRRHIREIGGRRTICHCYGYIPSPEWSMEPKPGGVIDECPECRLLAELYAQRSEVAGG